jgi:hypothetical protein
MLCLYLGLVLTHLNCLAKKHMIWIAAQICHTMTAAFPYSEMTLPDQELNKTKLVRKILSCPVQCSSLFELLNWKELGKNLASALLMPHYSTVMGFVPCGGEITP